MIGREDDDGDDTSEDDDASGGDVEMALISGEEHRGSPIPTRRFNEAQTPFSALSRRKQDKKLMAFFSLVFIQGMHADVQNLSAEWPVSVQYGIGDCHHRARQVSHVNVTALERPPKQRKQRCWPILSECVCQAVSELDHARSVLLRQ